MATACYNALLIQLWDLRLIPSQLAVMKLDWTLTPYRPQNQSAPVVLRVELVDSNSAELP